MSAARTLLQVALASANRARRVDVTDEEVQLAIAWVKKQITFRQVVVATKKKGSTNVYSLVARAMRKAHEQGKINFLT